MGATDPDPQRGLFRSATRVRTLSTLNAWTPLASRMGDAVRARRTIPICATCVGMAVTAPALS
jgi:hypothetical protein